MGSKVKGKKRKTDYRLTRHGRGIDGSKDNKGSVIETFQVRCPNCLYETEHQLIETIKKNRKAGVAKCQVCGLKRFWRWIEESSLSDPSLDKYSVSIQSVNLCLWGWVRNHIDEVVIFEVPEKMHLFPGRLGHRRHKGKPAFSNKEFHPEFLRYLETPKAIKILKGALEQLERDNKTLHAFIVLRAKGFSYRQIDDMGLNYLFEYPLNKTDPNRIGGRYSITEFGQALNKQAMQFLLSILPDELTKSFGSKTIRDSLSKSGDDRQERIICPKCGGVDNDCSLCGSRKRKWDGTIPRWLFDAYQKRIENGGVWELKDSNET